MGSWDIVIVFVALCVDLSERKNDGITAARSRGYLEKVQKNPISRWYPIICP
jgi:hypothetical protein